MNESEILKNNDFEETFVRIVILPKLNDKILTHEEEEEIYRTGKEHGFSIERIRELIEENLIKTETIRKLSKNSEIEETFVRMVILPKLDDNILTYEEEEEIYRSAKGTNISPDRVRILIEESLIKTGAVRASKESFKRDEQSSKIEHPTSKVDTRIIDFEKEYGDADIQYWTKEIELDPNFEEAYYKRGNVYYNKGLYDEAIRDYNKAIELNPEYVEAYNNKGVCYFNKGQYDQAIKNYNKGLEIDPDNETIYYNLGEVYFKKGLYDESINNYTKMIKLRPDYVNAYYNRGIVYYNKKQYDKAIKDFNKALSLKPNDADIYTVRGITFYKKGNIKKAKSDWEKGCTLGNSKACALYNSF